jgi:hypothetical protein
VYEVIAMPDARRSLSEVDHEAGTVGLALTILQRRVPLKLIRCEGEDLRPHQGADDHLRGH